MKKSRLLGVVCAVLCTTLSASVCSVTLTYTNQAEFLSVIGPNFVLEDFESYPTDLTFQTSIATTYFTATTVPNSGGDSWLLLGDHSGNYVFDGANALVAGSESGDAFTLSFTFNAPINYIGFNLIGFGNTTPGTLTMLTDAGDSFLLAENPPQQSSPSNIYFFGLINTNLAFSELTFIKTSLNDGIGFDEIYFSAVPIPPSIWLFGSGLLGLIEISRRNKVAMTV